MPNSLKRFTQDGLFSFSLPSEWSHDVGPDGTQVFWHPQSGSGTLRVSSVTSNKSVDCSGAPAAQVLNKKSTISIREDGVAWTSYREIPKRDEKSTLMLWWELANFIAPKYFRIAFFSFTIYAHEEEEEASSNMINLLHKQLPATEFGPLLDWE
jgi:hypothetical protein